MPNPFNQWNQISLEKYALDNLNEELEVLNVEALEERVDENVMLLLEGLAE